MEVRGIVVNRMLKASLAVKDPLPSLPSTKAIRHPGRQFTDFVKQKIPSEIRFILMMFLTTRAILTLIGVASRLIMQPHLAAGSLWNFSGHPWLDIWGVGDARWYLDIVRYGYSTKPIGDLHGPNYAFFPAYPILVKLLDTIVGAPYVAGLLLSNMCLVIAGIGLYKLTLIDSNIPTALGAVKYLFLFPTAFIYSAFLSESLFVALLIGCFYFAGRGRWLAVGLTGFALALTKPVGAIVVIPLLMDYAIYAHWSLKRVRSDVFSLVLIPLGLLAFAGYNYYLTGDSLAFVRAHAGWFTQPINPLKVIADGLTADGTFPPPAISFRFGTYFTIGAIALLFSLLVSSQRIGVPYWALGMCLIAAPLATGTTALPFMPRFTLVIFPLYVVLASIATTHQRVDQMMTVTLALLQGFLMAFWTSGIGFPM